MYNCITNIKITQQGTGRNKVLNFDFVTNFTCNSSWADLTNTGTITIPKNLYYKDQYGQPHPVFGTNVNIGGFSNETPLVKRGDKVLIEAGYLYYDKSNSPVIDTTTFFEGYVTKVGSKIPIELSIEDNMWLLKQIPAKPKAFSGTQTLEEILSWLLQDTAFTYKATSQTTFGSFIIQDETVCQCLYRLRKEYGFESYFRGNELRCGTRIYFPEESTVQNFVFQRNIIDDDLVYQRKDDIKLSALAKNTVTEFTGRTTKDGHAKTKKKTLQVLVTLNRTGEGYKYKVIEPGGIVPENDEGERRTFFFPMAKTAEELAQLAYEKIKVYYYDGFKGHFTTFGIPFVQMNDNARIRNAKLPEQDGVYKIKSVEYSGGINGLRQQIHLDFKLNGVG